ncbi:hypothetical protein SAMN06297164_3590 [Nitrosomonas ureae]|uniref:Uncharacterized protein n=1 Tax=Nitrosomonas ureae TaxID=44577 RepID=A0A286ALL5_9PROT|nr:hypothetical protein SAMN06297164_3590 [Nitrosomonas ureae]
MNPPGAFDKGKLCKFYIGINFALTLQYKVVNLAPYNGYDVI